jgi:ribose-phosphate pyrophosphokinase
LQKESLKTDTDAPMPMEAVGESLKHWPISKRLEIYSGRSNPELGLAIASVLDMEQGAPNLTDFASGETYCRYEESIRGADVFIIQTHSAPVNNSIMEQLIMIDAAKRASAKHITAVIPYYGYSRQDRKAREREPISAKLLADMLEKAGADRVMTMDLHSPQIQGYFDCPVDLLTAMPVLIDHFRDNIPEDTVIVAPDSGRAKVAERYGNHLQADIAVIHKRHDRNVKNSVKATRLIGEVAGRACLIIDDMIDTAGTMCAAAELLMEKGAREVIAAGTHGILSDPAVERLDNSVISRLIVTDTLPQNENARRLSKLSVVTAAPIIAAAIKAVFTEESITDIFHGDNQV